MDNATHTFLGLVLARGHLVRDEPLTTSAWVIGANLPDVDLIWSTGTDLAYFHFHRGFTHSLAGAALLAIALWGALLAVGRWRAGRGAARAAPFRLLAAAGLGVASHLALDAANAYGIRLFLPWSDRWSYGDLFTIADPWIWLLLGGVLYLSRRSGGWRTSAWAAAAILVTAAMAALPVVPPGSLLTWVALLAGVAVWGRRRGPVGDAGGRWARRALAVLVAYACLCASTRAAARVRIGERPSTLLPRLADPWRWDEFRLEGRSVRIRVLNALPWLDPIAGENTWTGAPPDDPSVAALDATCAGPVLREFFRFPVASVERGPGGEARVHLRDLRFSRDGFGGFGSFEAAIDETGRAQVDPADCP